MKRTAVGEGIDYETVEMAAEDVPDPYQYAQHLVDVSNTVTTAYDALGWLRRLQQQASEAQGRRAA